MVDDASRTDVSLLLRVGREPTDQAAWSAFVDRYAPKIYAWCRAWHLQEADAQDVTQIALFKLARQMQRFRYEPGGSFRGWLRTLTENSWRDWQADRRRDGAIRGEEDFAKLIRDVNARDDLERRLEQEFDLEVLELAQARVRVLISARTWEAYRLTAVEGVPGVEAAERLGMNVAAVFKAKSNVLRRLQDEVSSLLRSASMDPDE
jgi:RNA polymerase sigma-70 factor (ECF subfamily)